MVVDQEQLEGIDGAGHQVVVGIFAVVQMEAAQLAFIKQKGHDVLDVGPLRVVADVYQHFGLLPQPAAHHK